MKLLSELLFWVPFSMIFLELSLLLFLYFRKEKLFSKYLKLSAFITLLLVAFMYGKRIFLVYLTIKESDSPIKDYLLSDKNGILHSQINSVSKGFLLVLAGAVILSIVTYTLWRYQKKEVLDENLPLVIFIVTLISGLINILPVVILAFLLAIIWQLVKLNKEKDLGFRVNLVPFVLISGLIVIILNLFPFYEKFLLILHLA